jgi:phage baseplate assembly protein W
MSISLILPIKIGDHGLQSFKDSETKEAIQQNLKMLLLTNPGEYVMDPVFGVGLSGFLFEQSGPQVSATIENRITKQAGLYMPYIRIENIDINFDNIDNNVMKVRIEYRTSDSVINEVFDLTTKI